MTSRTYPFGGSNHIRNLDTHQDIQFLFLLGSYFINLYFSGLLMALVPSAHSGTRNVHLSNRWPLFHSIAHHNSQGTDVLHIHNPDRDRLQLRRRKLYAYLSRPKLDHMPLSKVFLRISFSYLLVLVFIARVTR